MKHRRNSLVRIVVVAAVLALVLAACGSSSKSSGGSPATSAAQTGGTLVFGAEQWPDCINPINQCANSSWLQWLVPIHVLPRLDRARREEQLRGVAADHGAADASNGGVTGAGTTFTVTYHLNPDAKWRPTARRSRRPT